jgi:hypothetical protein
VIAGHFGFAAAVKSRVPAAPLWSLMLASVWLDVVFTPLFLSGVETMAPFGNGSPNAYGGAVIHADWTHSLLGALVIAAVFGLVCAIPWGRKIGAVMGAVVFSHWVLDLPMHHHDLPLLPGNAGQLPLLGFGLWSFPAFSALLELALVALGAWLYWRAAVSVASAGGVERKRAGIAATAIALSGIVTLALNLAGL